MEDFYERAFTREHLPQWLFAGGVLLLIIAGFVWWTQVYESPYNVYWGMLGNSLSASSVTKHIVEKSSGTNLDEYVGENFGMSNAAYARTTLTDAASTIKTETVGTMNADFVRYTSINTKQKNKSGKAFDFSNVLGKWAKSAAQNSSNQTTAVPFWAQTTLGLENGNVVPIASLSATGRAALIKQLHDNTVFDTSFSNVEKSKQNGRPVYTYSLSVEPVAYVAFEKAFAADLGIKALNSLDPNNYQGEQAVKVNLTVDVHSHQLVEVSYPGTSHQEFYSSWGVPVAVPTPHATVSGQALQGLINQIK